MGSFDRNYSDGFHAYMRHVHPDAGPSVIGDLARSAITGPAFAAGAIVLTTAEIVYSRVQLAQVKGRQFTGNIQRFAQEMSDHGEDSPTGRSVRERVTGLLDRATAVFPLEIDVNPVPQPDVAQRPVRGLASLLDSFGGEAWRAVPRDFQPAQEPPIGRRSGTPTEDHVL